MTTCLTKKGEKFWSGTVGLPSAQSGADKAGQTDFGGVTAPPCLEVTLCFLVVITHVPDALLACFKD